MVKLLIQRHHASNTLEKRRVPYAMQSTSVLLKNNCSKAYTFPVGYRPVIVKRALIGSKCGGKLSTIFKLKSAS